MVLLSLIVMSVRFFGGVFALGVSPEGVALLTFF